jgi:hypothetical protein
MMNPEDLPEPIRAALEANAAATVRNTIDSGHLREWLTTTDDHTARNVELLLHAIGNGGIAVLMNFQTTLRTANHLRFGWCLDCGEDHAGALPNEALIGHTIPSQSRDLQIPQDEIRESQPGAGDQELRLASPTYLERVKEAWHAWLHRMVEDH